MSDHTHDENGRIVIDTKFTTNLERAALKLKPDVVRIIHQFRDDWDGKPSVFFRLLISNASATRERLAGLCRKIEERIRKETHPDEYGRRCYFNYRTVSEQEKMQDADWE